MAKLLHTSLIDLHINRVEASCFSFNEQSTDYR